MGEYFFDIIIYFTLYSFIGWVIETIYSSAHKKEFVNRGFLNGPFCPIYGFGAILIIQVARFFNNNFSIMSNNVLIKIFIAMLLTTILEYITGYILEKMFKCKWWDYSDYFLNLHGRVCLQYSLYWGILSYILITFIHPIIIKYVSFFDIPMKLIISVLVIIYFTFDTTKSVTEIIDLKTIVLQYHKNPLGNFYGQVIKHRRIFQAFPKLRFLKIGKLNQEIREYVQNEFRRIKIKVKEKVR